DASAAAARGTRTVTPAVRRPEPTLAGGGSAWPNDRLRGGSAAVTVPPALKRSSRGPHFEQRVLLHLQQRIRRQVVQRYASGRTQLDPLALHAPAVPVHQDAN